MNTAKETKNIIKMLKAALRESENSYRHLSYLYENALAALADLDPWELDDTAHVLGVVDREIATEQERIPCSAIDIWLVHALVRMPLREARAYLRAA